jgi:DNA-nicking Smr family endonuclease
MFLQNKMNKYLRTPNKIIDLHGYTTAEAKIILDDLLKSDESYVRIIVGKGNHTGGVSVLRDFVKKYFFSKNIHFNQSKIQDGGEGALEVFL